jgi:transcriptional regulator with XRE-family HTH domain
LTLNREQAHELGRFLRRHRKEQHLTTRAVAEAADVDRTTVIRLEQGYFTRPHPAILRRVAVALGISTVDVFALAAYDVPADLPTLKPYLRTKYRELPPEAVEQIEAYAANLARRHGVYLNGPAAGEDEGP